MLRKKKIIIIDGYNVLRNEARYAELVGVAPDFHDWSSEVLNAAREALLNDVALMVDKNCEAIIVYDGANRPAEIKDPVLPSQKLKYLQVVFTDSGESADTRIQNLAFKFREKAFEVEVVSSDLGIQDATMNKGVVRTSARVFADAAKENSQETSMQTISSTSTSSAAQNGALKNIREGELRGKIEDIVDSEIAEKLRALRDSL